MQRFNNNTREKAVEMSVKYRFKSSIEFSTVLFPGTYISVGDLRKEITKQKRLAPNADYELQIMNSETKHVYEFDPTLIPANTNLIVSRIPVVVSKQTPSQRENEVEKNSNAQISPLLGSAPAISNQFPNAVESPYYQQNHYENTNSDYNYSNYYSGEYDSNTGYNYGNFEEQSSEGYNYYDYEYGEYGYSKTDSNTTVEPNPNLQYIPMTATTTTNKSHRFVPYSRRTSKDDTSIGQTVNVNSENNASVSNEAQTALSTSPTGNGLFKLNPKYEKSVPLSYKCFKCNVPGHWIKHCPLLAAAEHTVKKSTGIPRSQMIIVSDAVDGAYITPEGRYAVPVTHMEAKLGKRQ